MPAFTRIPNFKRHQLHRDLAILVLTVGVCALPFLSQPFHMDDNFYMDMARNALVKPLFPNDTPYVFDGHFVPDMGSHSHPPLQTYFLALMQCLFGEGPGKERLYHSCALVFPLLSVLALYFIASRFVERPLWPSIVLACSPLFMVMQHNLMTDMPTLAFCLAAIATFLWATDLRSKSLYAASAIFQFAAMFTSYQALALAVLLGYYLYRKSKRDWIGWLCLVLPLVAMSAWFGMNYGHYHRLLFVDTVGYINSRRSASLPVLGTKLVAVLEYQGWLILFPFFPLYLYGRKLRGRMAALATLLAIYLAQALVPQYRFPDKAIFILGLVTGIFVTSQMGVVLSQSFRKNEADFQPEDGLFLGLWYFGVLAYCLLLFTEGSARYILPLIPPVLICYFRRLELSEVSEYRLPIKPLMGSAMLASGSLIITLAWGLLLSHADQEFACIYPRAASEFARIAGKANAYFVGEWGFRYYFGRAGVNLLPMDESLVRGGSFIAIPQLALPHDLPADLRSMTMPVQTLTYEVNTPLRTFDWATPAGFYSTGWGLIPFSLSRQNLESVEVRQVNYLVERLPWARVQASPPIPPWPGYLAVDSRSPLALLMKPETRILYPWDAKEPYVLDVQCGVDPGAYKQGSDVLFEFRICHLDGNGKPLAVIDKIVQPGVRKDDGKWQRIQLELEKSIQGGETLELAFKSPEKKSNATGAFAEAILRPVY